MGPLKVHDGPLRGPNRSLFTGSLRIEVGPLIFLCFFLSFIHQLNLVLSFWPPWDWIWPIFGPLGTTWAPKGRQDHFTLIHFSSFLPFSKTETVPLFAFTALFWAAFFPGPFLGPPGDPSWAPHRPSWARGPVTTVTPVTVWLRPWSILLYISTVHSSHPSLP
jgi:hypothetical protein